MKLNTFTIAFVLGALSLVQAAPVAQSDNVSGQNATSNDPVKDAAGSLPVEGNSASGDDQNSTSISNPDSEEASESVAQEPPAVSDRPKFIANTDAHNQSEEDKKKKEEEQKKQKEEEDLKKKKEKQEKERIKKIENKAKGLQKEKDKKRKKLPVLFTIKLPKGADKSPGKPPFPFDAEYQEKLWANEEGVPWSKTGEYIVTLRPTISPNKFRHHMRFVRHVLAGVDGVFYDELQEPETRKPITYQDKYTSRIISVFGRSYHGRFTVQELGKIWRRYNWVASIHPYPPPELDGKYDSPKVFGIVEKADE